MPFVLWTLLLLLLLLLSRFSRVWLCDPINGSPPGSPIPGILQARTLEWVAISSSKAWKWKVTVKSLSHIWLVETPWTAAYQAPPSMGFSRQEYWSGVPLPSPLELAALVNIPAQMFSCLSSFVKIIILSLFPHLLWIEPTSIHCGDDDNKCL